jgi:repressor LexA
MTDELTKSQQRVFDVIADKIQKTGLPPTIREIAERLSVSIGAVQDHLDALEKKGVLKRVKDRARGLLIAGRRDVGQKVSLPILGRVPAGLPLEAISNVEDYLSIDESIAKQANFVLRIKGDSMSPEIHDGDLALVKTTQVAENGDIVVAMLQDDGEATVKTLRRKGRDIFLEAINPSYAPIQGRPFTIVGKVTSLIRTFF